MMVLYPTDRWDDEDDDNDDVDFYKRERANHLQE